MNSIQINLKRTGKYYLTWIFALVTMTGIATNIPDSGESEILVISFGSNFVDKANSMVVDDEGNMYVTGSFQGEIYAGDEKIQAKGDADIFLAKINSSGEIEWLRQAGSNFYEKHMISETSNSIRLDDEGNVIICGVFTGAAAFGDTTIRTKGGSDVFVAKYSNAGDLLWVSTFGNHGCNICRDMLVDKESIYFSGTSNGSFVGDKTIPNKPLAFLGALNHQGGLEWVSERCDTATVMIINTMLAWQDNELVFGTVNFRTQAAGNNGHEKLPYYLKLEKFDKKGNAVSSGIFDLATRPDFEFKYENNRILLLIDNANSKTVPINELMNSSAQYFLQDEKNTGDDEKAPSKSNYFNRGITGKGFLCQFEEGNLFCTPGNALILDYNKKRYPILNNISIARMVNSVISNDNYYYVLLNYFGGFNEELGIYNKPGSQDMLIVRIEKRENIALTELIENSMTEIINLFPNPSRSGIFQLEVNTTETINCQSISILNQENRQVKYMKVETLPYVIDLSDMSAGHYSIVFELDEGRNVIKKVITL